MTASDTTLAFAAGFGGVPTLQPRTDSFLATGLEAAQAELNAWKKKLVEVGGTVPQVHQMAQAQTTAVPTQIMATPPQPQLMAPALQSQMQARPGCA